MAKYTVEVKAIGGWTRHSEWESYRDAVDQADMVHGRITSDGITVDDETELCGGAQVQVDVSGQGHCWKNVAARELPSKILDEIMGEMIDGGKDECDDFLGSNGLHYRWC